MLILILIGFHFFNTCTLRLQLFLLFSGLPDSGPRTVDVYITKLRDKFSACPDFEIVTVHGLGYKAVLK